MYEALVVRAVKPATPPVIDPITGGARGRRSVGAAGGSIGGIGGDSFIWRARGRIRVAAWTIDHRLHLVEALVSPSGLPSGRVGPGRKNPLPSTKYQRRVHQNGGDPTVCVRLFSYIESGW